MLVGTQTLAKLRLFVQYLKQFALQGFTLSLRLDDEKRSDIILSTDGEGRVAEFLGVPSYCFDGETRQNTRYVISALEWLSSFEHN